MTTLTQPRPRKKPAQQRVAALARPKAAAEPAWMRAFGCAPAKPGTEPPEVTQRRVREREG